MYCSIISDLIFSHFVHINNLKCFSGHTISQKRGFDWYLKWIFTFLRDQIVDKHRTYSNFLSIYFRYSNAPLSAPALEQGTPPAETDACGPRLHRGTPSLSYCWCVMCSCVWRPALLKKNKTCRQRRKNTVTHRCLMCSILDGLVICLWLFFMLHLPLFGCLKIPCTLYWFGSHDVNCHTKLAGIVSGSKRWHREGHFLHSHAFLHNVCRVSCQSAIVVNSLIVSAEVATPLQFG